MRSLWFVLAIAFPLGLAAQNPGDSGIGVDSVRLDSLREEILDRYRTRAHEVLSLSTDQVGRFDSTQAHAWAQRRDLMLQRQRINMALRWQLRPGVAASPDSVSRLLDARRRVSESLFRVDDQEDRDMAGFLTPVQRAQYQEFRQRFRERVAEAMRGGRPGMMRPGLRPGRRPRP
jgi:hypothetical protein